MAASYNRFPDEKGTESVNALTTPVTRFTDEKGTKSPTNSKSPLRTSSYNRFPDEKGTESFQVIDSPAVWLRPDEKGTESLKNASSSTEVTIVSPMKRGLKV